MNRRSFLQIFGGTAVAMAIPAIPKEKFNPWEIEPSAVAIARHTSESSTSIVVDDSRMFLRNSDVYVPQTGEVMRVIDVTNQSYTLIVHRGWCGTPASEISEGDAIVTVCRKDRERKIEYLKGG